MTAFELLFTLGSQDIYPSLEGGKIRLSKPCPPHLKPEVIKHKQAIFDYLSTNLLANHAPPSLELSPEKADVSEHANIVSLISWQSAAIVSFCQRHSTNYRAHYRDWTDMECDMAAMRDLLEWQHCREAKAPSNEQKQ